MRRRVYECVYRLLHSEASGVAWGKGDVGGSAARVSLSTTRHTHKRAFENVHAHFGGVRARYNQICSSGERLHARSED
jgi:hypothetical protein